MASRVTLQPSGHSYPAWPGQSLLEAGLGAGLALPFRCSDGNCGECRARVVSGHITRLRPHDYVLSERDKLAGHCLMCSNAADGPVMLEVQEAQTVDDIPEQTLIAKRSHVEQSDDVLIARFKFVRGKAFRFLPGQHASLLLPDGQVHALPIASCPCDTAYVEFHLPARTTSAMCGFAEAICALGPRDRVTVSGPAGRFTVNHTLVQPQLFLATGIGFGALQGLMEHCLRSEPAAQTCLLWARDDHTGYYRHSLCRAWADAFDEFSYTLIDAQDPLPTTLPQSADVYVANGADALLSRLLQSGYQPSSLNLQSPPDQTGDSANA